MKYYTDVAQRALVLAEDEAMILLHRNSTHRAVSTEHLILGLLRVDKGVSSRVLKSFGITLSKAREIVERIPQEPCDVPELRMSLTRAAQEIVEVFAWKEAGSLGHDTVGGEHILLAIISRDPSVIEGFGLKPDLVRKRLFEYYSMPPERTES